MLLHLLEFIGRALVRSAAIALVRSLQEDGDVVPVLPEGPPATGCGDPILLEHLDRLDRAEFEENRRLYYRQGRDDHRPW